MSQLTDFERGRIIGCWEAGESTCDIAGALNHSQSQVTYAIKTFKEEYTGFLNKFNIKYFRDEKNCHIDMLRCNRHRCFYILSKKFC